MTIPDQRAARRQGRIRPFHDGAPEYRAAGWKGLVPVSRTGTKRPLARGITGHDGVDASPELLTRMVRKHEQANIGLRLPHDVIGIDVDDYDGHGGGQTLGGLAMRIGALPVTWRSTSRAPEDGVSGIYLFRAPRERDWLWVSDLGPGSGIEIIQRHHRFAVVWPSIHNMTGREYLWWRGEQQAGIPRPGQLPLLPVAWARYLLSARAYQPGVKATDGEMSEWYARVSGGPMCEAMRDSARDQAARVRAGAGTGGLHDTLIAAVTHLCRNAAEGHRGLERALGVVEEEFMAARRSRDLRAEWRGAVLTAQRNAAGGKQEEMDPCQDAGLLALRRTNG